MEAVLIEILQANAPLLVIVAIGFWRVVVALHKIDGRLITLETLERTRNKESKKW